MIGDDDPGTDEPTQEDDNVFINYAENMPREKLEALVNALIGPLIEYRDLFDCRDLSHQNAVEMLSFWYSWLGGISEIVTDLEWFRHLSIPDEVISPGSTDSAVRFVNTFESLNDDQQAEIENLMNQLDQAKAACKERHALTMEKKDLATEHIRNKDFEDLFGRDFSQLTSLDDYIKDTAEKKNIDGIAQTAMETYDEEWKQITHDYAITFVEICQKMEQILRFDPSDYLTGNPLNIFFAQGKIPYRIEEIMELHRGILFDLARGQKNVFTEGLSQNRGRPEDPIAVKMLKDRIGQTYRALRKIGASQTEAVSAINDTLKEYKIPIVMEPEAIRKRAPENLSLPEYAIPLFFDMFINTDGKLKLFPDESRADKFKEAATWWLFPYTRDALRFFGK